MQAQFLVGPIPSASSPATTAIGPHNPNFWTRRHHHHRRWLPPLFSSPSWSAVTGDQNHYDVLGLSRTATSSEIKRAYRLLARKYHPDVSKHSQAAEVFKSIRLAYEVLSNESSRMHYDKALKFHENRGTHYRGKKNYGTEFDDRVTDYRWAELRRRMQYQRYWERYNVDEEDPFYGTTDEEVEVENPIEERGPFTEVLRSVFLLLFLVQTFGSRISLTVSSFMAFADRKLDTGYKIGYLIAWILGGRGGILLTLCLSFASWVCGKTSSSIVVLVIVAMWVGSNLARYAPLPQGALLTLLYMSIKLQVDLK